MKTLFIVLMLGIVLLATGCPKEKLDLSTKATKEMAVEQMRKEFFKSEIQEFYCWQRGRDWKGTEAPNGTPIPENCKDPATDTDTEAMAKAVRNRAFQRGRGIVDEVYFKYSNGIRRKRSITDFLLDLADIGTSTAIGFTKGNAGTLRDMGIALAGFRGGRSAYNLRIYDDQTTEVILDQMDASRNELLLVYENNSRTRSSGDYSMEDVFADIFRYFAVGSQTEAFKRIRRKTATSAALTENAVLQLDSVSPELAYFPPADTFGLPRGLERMIREFDKQEKSSSKLVDGESDDVKKKKKDKIEEINKKLNAIYTELSTEPGLAAMQAFLNKAKEKFPDMNFTSDETSAKDKIEFMEVVRQAIGAARVANANDPAANAALKRMHAAFEKQPLTKETK